MYCMKGGMTYGDIQGMYARDREWHLARLFKQLQLEEEEHKKAMSRTKGGRGKRRR